MADTAAHLVDRVPSLRFCSAITQEDLSELGFHLDDRLSYLGPAILPTTNATEVLSFGHCKRRRSRRPSPLRSITKLAVPLQQELIVSGLIAHTQLSNISGVLFWAASLEYL
jgi:hypothetical protein